MEELSCSSSSFRRSLPLWQCPHPAGSPELVPGLREQEPGLSAHSCGHVESRAVRNGIWGMQMEVCQAFCTLAN